MGALLFKFRSPESSWIQSTLRIRNIPAVKTDEEIALWFEGRKIWGRELDVSQVVRDANNDFTYVTFCQEKG